MIIRGSICPWTAFSVPLSRVSWCSKNMRREVADNGDAGQRGLASGGSGADRGDQGVSEVAMIANICNVCRKKTICESIFMDT